MRRATVLFGLFVAGCGSAEADRVPGPSVADSAGVRIVEYSAPSLRVADRSLTEVVRIGTADGPVETLFSSIAGGKILSDGVLVVVDASSREVRRFAADGTFLGAHGREGQGPGEYEFIIGTGECSETGFTVFDIGWTMSLYDDAGEFVNERVTRFEDGSTPYRLACARSGRVAVTNWDLAGEGPTLGFHVAMARLRILDSDGSELSDLGERIGSERFGRPTDSGPHPAGRSTRFGFLGSDLIVSDGSFFGFERWNAEGVLTEVVRIDVPPPDGDSLMAVYLESALSRAQDEGTRTRARRRVLEMEGPAQASFFSDLFVAADRVLLRELSVGESGRWFEFSSDGVPIGFLPLPSGAKLLDLVDSLVLVQEVGPLDVPNAVLYSVSARR